MSGHCQKILLALLLGVSLLCAEDVLDPMIVSAGRVGQPVSDVPMSVDVFTRERLRNSPATTLDATLREDAAFSLFRRTSSLIANPTAQGVSLRGIGPSGASRSLVLFDGVPLNDPFGGWVAWSKVPRLSLESVEIIRGGGSGVWGNAALGGTLAPYTAHADAPATEVEGQVGDFGTRSLEMATSVPAGPGFLRVDARAFRSDGFQVVDETRRGPIDQPLDSDHQLLQVDWWQPLATTLQLRITGRLFSEERGNGTPLQRNNSKEAFLSASLTGTPEPDFVWNGSVYVQRQDFSSYFSSVSADRTFETPANNQYEVPAVATGAAWTGTWFHPDEALTTLGVDARWVGGETREDYFFQAGDFTRRRFAGGEQWFAGAFAQHERNLDDWRITAALRADHWENNGGHRQEFDRQTGTTLRDDSYEAQNGWEISPRVGLAWQPDPRFRLRAAAYRAFRVPTLNEYYRPFRVGSVTTEANPDLQIETLDGVEVGSDSTLGSLSWHVTAFLNELHDAVANVTIATNSRQRQNLDSVRVQGLECGAEWSPVEALTLRLDGLLNAARVVSASAQPALEGRRLAQTPRWVLTAGADWQAPFGILAAARLRWTGRQYEDDENQLPLGEAMTLDLRVSRHFGAHTEIYAALENILDAEVETSRSNTDLLTFDAPRLFRGGLRVTW